jgi:hypothetical protein
MVLAFIEKLNLITLSYGDTGSEQSLRTAWILWQRHNGFSGHRLRATASTMLNELGFRLDVIER